MKQVVNYSNYFVDDQGNVFSTKRKELIKLKVRPNDRGYLYCTLCNKSVYKSVKVHRLVAQAFLGDIEGKVVDHIDGNKSNNAVSNLRICSVQDNLRFQNKKRNSNTGVSNIYKTPNGKFALNFCKIFNTLEEAIKAKEDYYSQDF